MPKKEAFITTLANQIKCAFLVVSCFVLCHNILTTPLFSQTFTHTITQQQKKIELADSIEFFVDTSRKLTLKDILSERYNSSFKKNKNSSLGFTWTHDAIWLRCKLRLRKEETPMTDLPYKHYLTVGNLTLDSATLFVYYPSETSEGKWRESLSGSGVELRIQEEKFENTTFPLVLPADTTVTIFVRVVSKTTIVLAMTVYSHTELRERMQRYDIVISGCVSVIFATLIFHLVIAFRTRKRVFLFYCLYAFSTIIFLTSVWGAPYRIFASVLLPCLGQFSNISLGLICFFVWLFGQEFLQAQQIISRKYTYSLAIVTVFVALSTIFSGIFPLLGFVANYSLLPNFLLPLTAYLGVRKGNKEYWYYIVGWVPLTSVALLMVLVSNGILNILDQHQSFAVLSGAMVFESVIYFFALVIRYGKIWSEHRFLVQQEEYERKKNIYLEESNTQLTEAFLELQQAHTQLQKEQEKIRILNEELEGRDKEKNEFLGIVAHDLRNPLAVIMISAELMERKLSGNRIAKDFSEVIIKNVTRMLALIKNLLDLNAIEQGGMKFHPVHIDISQFAKLIVDQYYTSANAKNITIHYSSESLNTNIYIDEQVLVHILDNIISNAVKYSPQGKHVFVTIKADNAAVRVEVRDEGQGISTDDMKKLFGKFARLSARPTGGEHSTGLGLSIVKKMVEAMNGRVWCESELGKGTTFIVELPSSLQI